MKHSLQHASRTGRGLSLLLLVAGIVGFAASMMLTVETMKYYQDPSYSPLCSLNPVLSCKSVMATSQASVVGFTNSLVGIAAFAALAAVGAALLAGAELKRWYWLVLLVGATFGMLFVHWLIFQSLYRIGALCPYCMVVWLMTIPTFWYLLVHVLKQGHLSAKLAANRVAQFIQRHRHDILVAWLLLITALVLVRFWYYFGTLL